METMLPLSPEEIVEVSILMSYQGLLPVNMNSLRQLYVGERNKNASEADFLNALDLLQIAYEVRFTVIDMYILSIYIAGPFPYNYYDVTGSLCVHYM